MEKFFKPVHSHSAPDKIKLQKHHLHHHHPHHHQDLQSQRYTLLDDADKITNESQGHLQYQHYHHDSQNHHPNHQFHSNEEDEILFNHSTPVTLSWASSSSLSSSSSGSTSSSWYTEARANNPFCLRNAERPQHSLSCSNIPDVHRCFREDESSEPVVFATIKHGRNGSVCASPKQPGKHMFSPLDRGHSRSEEGLLQGNDDEDGEQYRTPNFGPLYKTASLNQSLTFSEEDILLGVSRGPKRAVSSSQLPSKGILKNKEANPDIRRAKSMEVLSPRVAKKREDPNGQNVKRMNQEEIEQARANFVEGKLQFSAFLDEITKQVISPSELVILGVKNKTAGKPCTPAQTPGEVKPQLPPKKYLASSCDEREPIPKQHNRKHKTGHSSSGGQTDSSNTDKLMSYAARSHQGSPPPHHNPGSSSQDSHRGKSRKDKRLSLPGGYVSGGKDGRCCPQQTDGTSTSSEPRRPRHWHHRKQQTPASNSSNTPKLPQPQPLRLHPSPGQRGLKNLPPDSANSTGAGLGSESSSSKSDSSRARDAPSTSPSHSSEHSGQHHSHHVGNTRKQRDTLPDVDHLQALQEENSDLHQNLLQTVVCIESLETELQRTRDELCSVKEKYKSLLDTHTGTKHANSLLGEHLHIASESLSSERKYLLHRVSQLGSELEEAHRTIALLENINVPLLIKELLEKHFDSAVQKLLTSGPSSLSAASPQDDQQLGSLKADEDTHDWLKTSEPVAQTVPAFVPFKQSVETKGNEASSCSPLFSVADISTAIYEKIATSNIARPQPLYSHDQQPTTQGTNYTDTLPNCQQVQRGDNLHDKGDLKVMLMEEDVTAMSAQQILNGFIEQLQAYKGASRGKEQPAGHDWAGGAHQTDKAAD